MKRLLILLGALFFISSAGHAASRKVYSGGHWIPVATPSRFSYSRSGSSFGLMRSMSGGGRGMGRGIMGGTGVGRFANRSSTGSGSTGNTSSGRRQTPSASAGVGTFVASPGMFTKTDPNGGQVTTIYSNAGGIHYDNISQPEDQDKARGPFTDPVLSGYGNTGSSSGGYGTLYSGNGN